MLKLLPKLITLGFLTLGLAACEVADIPNFERMTLDELAAYNQGRPLGQMIVCSEESRSFSRVRRRRCMTVEAMYGSADQISQLGLLNTVPGYGNAE